MVFIEINELELSFSMERKGSIHKLTIWTDGGFAEVYMTDKNLEELKKVIRCP